MYRMLYIAICDDENYFCAREQELISEYLSQRGHKAQFDLYASGEELLRQGLKVAQYDIIFLDVNMDKMDGIETAQRIRKISHKNFIVFVTAFVQYAVSGYEVDAIRFILKDDQYELRLKECMDAILQRMKGRKDKHVFTFQEGIVDLPYEHLLYVESRLHKVLFHVINEQKDVYTMYGKLDPIDEILHEAGFIRTHQSYLVNLRNIQGIKRYSVKLTDGRGLAISKARYQDAVERWICYKGEI